MNQNTSPSSPARRARLLALASTCLALSACTTVQPVDDETAQPLAASLPASPHSSAHGQPLPAFEVIGGTDAGSGRRARFGSGGALIKAPPTTMPLNYDGPDADEIVKLQFASVNIREIVRTILRTS